MIVTEIPSLDPLKLVSAMADRPHTHLLHGGEVAAHPSWGRGWSIFVTAPAMLVTLDGERLSVNDEIVQRNPFDLLQEISAQRHDIAPQAWPIDLPDPGFLSGAIGYLSYEMAAHCSPPLPVSTIKNQMPEMQFGFYDAVVLKHRATKRCFISAKTPADFAQLKNIIAAADSKTEHSIPPVLNFMQFDEEQYKRDVENIRFHIREGDIFQANLTHSFLAQLEATVATPLLASALFHRLSRQSDAPYSALLNYGGDAIISNSPECFMQVKVQASKKLVACEPIKGTARRYNDMEQDKNSADMLLVSEKDRAENIMIADLVRNDLSRSCKDDSIVEAEICSLRSFRRVHHLVSRIEGELRDGVSAVAALKNAFPCGSITGAPKERAMELLLEIEKNPRGVYCGAIGYLDDRGGAEFSVPIRTMAVQQTDATIMTSYGAGGGITLLSDPREELQEVLLKAEAFFDLLQSSQPWADKEHV